MSSKENVVSIDTSRTKTGPWGFKSLLYRAAQSEDEPIAYDQERMDARLTAVELEIRIMHRQNKIVQLEAEKHKIEQDIDERIAEERHGLKILRELFAAKARDLGIKAEVV
jgi:hypothetical protein